MGMARTDADGWDFVEYAKVLTVWNAREKEATDAVGGSRDNIEDYSNGDTEPPSIEWMMADDARLAARGYEVN
jgi:hypothetical protein